MINYFTINYKHYKIKVVEIPRNYQIGVLNRNPFDFIFG